MPSRTTEILGIFLFKKDFEYNRIGVLYDSLKNMAAIEKRDISSLPEEEKDSYQNIERLSSDEELKNNLNDDLFQKLENGDATIQKHKGNLVFKVKDKNSSNIIDMEGKSFFGDEFLVKERTLINFLEKEKDTAETSAHYNSLLNKLIVVKNTQNELLDMRTSLDLNVEVKEDNINSILNGLIGYYYDVNNHRKPRTYSKDSRKGFKELKNKARENYSKLMNIKDDLGKRSYKDINLYIDKTDKLLADTQAFDKSWQRVVLKQYPGDIPTNIDNTTDAKNERRYQEGKLDKNNKFNSDLEQAEIADEANETLEVMQQELIADLDDTKNIINNTKQIGKNKIIRQINEFEDTVRNVKSKKELREKIVGIVYQIENLEQKQEYSRVKEKIKIKINQLKIKYKRKIKFNETKQDMINNGSYQKMRQSCKRSNNGMLNNMLVDGLAEIGLIDKNNKRQVEAVKKGGQFIQIAGMLVLGFKFIQTLFSKKGADNPNKRRNTALYGAGLYGLFNVDKLMNWGKDVYGGGKKNTVDSERVSETTGTNKETVDTYITPPYTTLATIGGIPINTLINPALGLISENHGEFKIDYKKYEEYLNNPQTKIDKDAKKTALENMKILEQDGGEMLNNGLNNLGINTLDDMKKIAGKDDKKTLLDSGDVMKYINHVSAPINKDLDQEGLKPKNAKAWYKMTQEFDEKNTDNNPQIADWIKRGLLVPKTSGPYNFNKMKRHPELDLKNKKINGLKLKFETYDELFKAMMLTDFIKEKFANKNAVNSDPFHIEMSNGGNIQFDNKDRYKVWEDETDVINSNWYKNTLEDISETLSDNKNAYVDYLNARWAQK